MDDPWGSPWADEAQFEAPGEVTNVNSTIEQAPATAATLVLTGATDSPWGDEDDDDDFGEWSSVPVKEEEARDFNVLETRWKDGANHNVDLRDGQKGELSSTWITAVAPADPIVPDFEIPQDVAVRSTSPDPWSVQATDSDTADHTSIKIPLPGAEHITDEELTSNYNEARLREKISDVNQVTRLQGQDGTTEQATVHTTIDPSLSISQQTISLSDHESPRTSTSVSESSHRGNEDRQEESPRTSMDDETKRPQLPRKVSSRIQPLVEHFDNLGKVKVVQVIETASMSHKIEPAMKSLEEVEDGIENIVESDDGPTKPLHDNEDASKKAPESDDTLLPTVSVQSLNFKKPEETPSDSEQQLQPKFTEPVEIELDLKVLDDLFPINKNFLAIEEVFIPDVVPHESFSSVEQRKTWYRISRYGSMHRHNNGIEDNHNRFMWSQSSVRDSTLKIVARWMDEDRLSGQVMLGGTGRTSTLFGWGDSKAPLVSLESVFAARQEKRKSTMVVEDIHSSLRDLTNESGSTSASDISNEGGNAAKSATALPDQSEVPVASFGWSSSQPAGNLLPPPTSSLHGAATASQNFSNPESYSQSVIQPLSLLSSTSISNPHNLSPGAHRNSTNLASTINAFDLSPDQPEPSTYAEPTGGGEDEEDDWGEMISTPIQASESLFALQAPASILPKHTSFEDLQSGSAQVSSPVVTDPVASPSAGTAALGKQQQNTSQPFAETVLSNGSVPVAGASDPWASADFSFFDSVTPALKLGPKAHPKLARPSPLKQVSFGGSTDPASKSTSHITRTAQSANSKSNQDKEQDIIVQKIIKGLPDLSYMLKR